MKNLLWATTLAVGTALAAVPSHAQVTNDLQERLDAATGIIHELQNTPDKGVPNSIVAKATCVGVIPSVKKGAFIVGASYGQGVVTCRTGHGWSAPVFIRIAGGSFGLQAGGEATDLVLVAVNDKGFQDLLHSKVKIGADASAAAGPVGRDTAASTDVLLKAELLTYSRAKGLFAGIDLDGSTISQNTDDTDRFYGKKGANYVDILHGKDPGTVPDPAKPFVSAVAHYFHSTR
jgi:SH3 domain-containing YSC84-like protein 1